MVAKTARLAIREAGIRGNRLTLHTRHPLLLPCGAAFTSSAGFIQAVALQMRGIRPTHQREAVGGPQQAVDGCVA